MKNQKTFNFKYKTDMKKEMVKSIPWIILLLIFASYVVGVFVGNIGIKLPF